jgi:hypothetical protein
MTGSLQTVNKLLQMIFNIFNCGSLQLFIVVKHINLGVSLWTNVKSGVTAMCSSPFTFTFTFI